jgi:hypothetical protein
MKDVAALCHDARITTQRLITDGAVVISCDVSGLIWFLLHALRVEARETLLFSSKSTTEVPA